MPKSHDRVNPSDKDGTSKTTVTHTTDIAIIGAGIAGLYCGYQLKSKNKAFKIAEASDHIGGRIWSLRYLENGESLQDGEVLRDNDTYDYVDETGTKHLDQRLEFCAEFGPMRIEIESQPYLRCLINKLGLKQYLQQFPPYESPASEHDPQYELTDEEAKQETPFDLLKLAVVRIIGRLRSEDEPVEPSKLVPDNVQPTSHALDKKLKEVVLKLSRAVATRDPDWKGILEEWIERLGEIDYQNIRQFSVFEDGTSSGTRLWNMGFWNLVSEVLSHHAVMKLRDMGTFYHLIPENPNAAEWLVFWLRALKTSTELVGIRGGMQRITERLSEVIGADQIKKGRKLTTIEWSTKGQIKLTFERNGDATQTEIWIANHVILALPTEPLKELANRNPRTLYRNFARDLGSVFGFPLLKLFFAVKERWWNKDATYTNRYATLIPTRELHYRDSCLSNSNKGLIMIYTDRPAKTFWANYVEPQNNLDKNETQGQVETPTIHMTSGAQTTPEHGKPNQNERLIAKILKYLKEFGHPKKKTDIEFYGIRDWGREPYRGACHAWYPQRKSWVFLKRLSAFSLLPRRPGDDNGRSQNVLHVCGEAYSDYQGFIEGALRSAAHVLHTISPDDFKETPTPWLCEHPKKHQEAYVPSEEECKPEKMARRQ